MTDKWVRRWPIKSYSHPEQEPYTVAVDKDGNWGCTCWPWKRTRQECDHIREAQALQAKEQNLENQKPKPPDRTEPWWLYDGQYADGTKRWTLLSPDAVSGLSKTTPYFIHKEGHPLDRGKPYALLGSGMGKPCWLAQGRRTAAILGHFHTLNETKAEAIRLYKADQAQGLL
ncbi:MAG: hypothetical protein FJ015_07090 [Chloroflexi bacterium]|nr:hypothetical protein [Chloroflexota bacterium]